MAYDKALAERVRKLLKKQCTPVEKEMFGGIAFMVDEKMCIGVNQDKIRDTARLLMRVGPEFYEQALAEPGCRVMDFAGRPMVGFVFVDPEGFNNEFRLAFWVNRGLEFNRQLPAGKATSKVAKKAAKQPAAKVKTVPKKKTVPKTKAKKAVKPGKRN